MNVLLREQASRNPPAHRHHSLQSIMIITLFPPEYFFENIS